MAKNPKKEKSKTLFKKEELILIVITFIIILFQISTLSGLSQLPGPLYGGDIFRERGYTEHILRGNSQISDPLFINEINYFPWMSHLISAKLSSILNISVDSIIIYLPVLMFAISIYVFYLLGNKIFKNKILASFFALISASKYIFYFKNTASLATVAAALSLYFWFKLKEDKKKVLYSILMGASGGFAALCHGSRFINIVVFLFALAFMELIYGLIKKEIKWTEYLKTYIPGAISGAAVSLIFFLPLILRYSMKTLNNSFAYALTNIDNMGPFWALGRMLKVFFNTQSTITFIIGIISLLGIIYCIINFKKKESQFVIALFFGTIISGMHYLITKPLLNKWMEPGHMLSLLFIPSTIFFIFGMYHLYLILKNKIKKAELLVYSLTIILIILVLFSTFNNFNNSQWTKTGELDEFTTSMFNLGIWIKTNTQKDDVFLSHDETAFALNAISGAKVVMSRRVHSSYFVDLNKRYADGIVMLYGKNKSKINELLLEYNVKYVYLDYFLTKSPMITELKYTNYLEENGIKFEIQDIRWDPSTLDAPTFVSIVVPYQKTTILNHTTPLINIMAKDQVIGQIYEVKIE